jgi:uncharacterized protein (TIGR03435 family)
MRTVLRLTGILAGTWAGWTEPGTLRAQNAKLQFEVASVRSSTPYPPGTPQVRGFAKGGPGTDDPERITYEHTLFQQLIMDAYGVQRDQITGPDWAATDSGRGALMFDISAKVPPGSSKEQAAIMLQNLLAERFKLSLHHETVQVSGFALVTAKSGPRLVVSAGPLQDSERIKPGAGGRVDLQTESDGFPQLFPGRNMGGVFKDGVVRMRFRDYPVPDLAQQIAVALGAHVVDKSGLDGKYDFKLEVTLPENGFMVAVRVTLPLNPGQPAALNRNPPDPAQQDAVPIISSAMEKQLGLRLEPIKIPIDTLVIDHVEKTPTEN